MRTYLITVYALGYETFRMNVQAASLYSARKQVYAAVTKWLEMNDVDEDTRGLEFTDITLVR